MRCPDCNKFVPFDDPVIQSDDVTLDGSTIVVNLTLTRACANCGSDLQEMSVEGSVEVEHTCSGDPTYTLLDWQSADHTRLDIAPTEKPLPRTRHVQYFGAQLTARILCETCKAVFSQTFVAEGAASDFEDLV